MKIRGIKVFLASALTAAAAMLSACGGGGAADSGTTPKTFAASTACTSVAGPLDVAQTAIADRLLNNLNSFPAASAVQGLLTTALSRVLDIPDALAGSLKGLAVNHDPEDFAAALGQGGDALNCALSDIQVALIELNRQAAAAGSSVPGLAVALGQVQSIQGMLLDATSGDVSLVEIADALGDLQAQLNTMAAQLPAPLNNPGTQFALNTLGVATSHISLLLIELGEFDGAGVSTQLRGTISALAAVITSSPMGLPTDKLAPIINGLTNALNGTVLTQLDAILVPLLNGLKTVLQPQGNPTQMFQDILAGGLAGTPLSGVFGTLLGKLSGGGTNGLGLPIPVLGPLLDTLLGGLLGGLFGG